MTKITAQRRAQLIAAIKIEWADEPNYAASLLDALTSIADDTELQPTTPDADYDDSDVDPKIDPHGAVLQSLEYYGLDRV